MPGGETMRLIFCVIALAFAVPPLGIAQRWEIGGLGGYGWYLNSTVSNSVAYNPALSADTGFLSRATLGVVFAENHSHHWGGEIRWLYQGGGPQIQLNQATTSMRGYSNLVTYDFVVYPVRGESGVRPYLAGGAGVKAYTASDFRFINQQPTAGLAVLRPVTQAEPAISVGGGLKYSMTKHAQFRVDFRIYFTPTPNDVIRATGPSVIHGWLSELVPAAGFSYVF
jgi:hypothetical protein